jgi:hypothetical protein
VGLHKRFNAPVECLLLIFGEEAAGNLFVGLVIGYALAAQALPRAMRVSATAVADVCVLDAGTGHGYHLCSKGLGKDKNLWTRSIVFFEGCLRIEERKYLWAYSLVILSS